MFGGSSADAQRLEDKAIMAGSLHGCDGCLAGQPLASTISSPAVWADAPLATNALS